MFFFGKAECEWINFREFWLGKLVELGFVIVESTPPKKALGTKGEVTFIKHKFKVTEKGFNDYDNFMRKNTSRAI